MRNRENVYRVKETPDRGAERFMTIIVTMTEKPVKFNYDSLDSVGKKKIRSINNPVSYQAIAEIEWKSEIDREACKEYQEGRNRWIDVEEYSERIINGEFPKINAVFLLPNKQNNTQSSELEPVDGTRRLMAFCEAGVRTIEVVVITEKTEI